MARYDDAKPKHTSIGYSICFGDQMGPILSKVQSTVISSGTELQHQFNPTDEQIILMGMTGFFPDGITDGDGTWLSNKKQIQEEVLGIHTKMPEADLWVFKADGDKRDCYIVELKLDGALDTKKSGGEETAMSKIMTTLRERMPGWNLHPKFCSFTRETKASVVEGYKNKIDIEDAMTGKELCELTGRDYEAISAHLTRDRDSNIRQVTLDLYGIPVVQGYIDDWRKEDADFDKQYEHTTQGECSS